MLHLVSVIPTSSQIGFKIVHKLKMIYKLYFQIRAITRKRFPKDQRWRCLIQWKTVVWQKHYGAAISPIMKLFVAQSAIYKCLWCTPTTRAMFAHAGAQSLFLRRNKHACVARTLRPPCTAVVMSLSAWPFQQGARCGSFHTSQIISRLNCCKHVPAIASRPTAPTPLTDTKNAEATFNGNCG